MSDQLDYPRIPREATFPAIGLPPTLTEYADAYSSAVAILWKAVPKSAGQPSPDHLSFPILFLVHHCLEAEIKEAITLSYAIRRASGDETPDGPNFIHDLVKLGKVLDSTLAVTPGFESTAIREEDSLLLEDLDKFAPDGQVLRYPYLTVNKKPTGDLNRTAVVDIPAVMKAFKELHGWMVGLVSELIEVDHAYWDALPDGP